MPTTTLTLSIDDRGQFSMTGPVHQTLLCYGMLEIARDIVRRAAEQPQQKIVTPSNGDVQALARGS